MKRFRIKSRSFGRRISNSGLRKIEKIEAEWCRAGRSLWVRRHWKGAI
jgi:hypothetical protein